MSARTEDRPEELPLSVLYEDDHIMVVDKPAGMVVHPGAGNRSGTLVNALLYHRGALAALPRAGIVHRLDKDTTGLLVVACNLSAHKHLVDQMKGRKIAREYEAVVDGRLVAGGTVSVPVGRHHIQRTRMSVTRAGKAATTHFRIIRRFPAYTHLRLQLETGRTHQIRVHMAHIGHPVFADPVYAGRPRPPPSASPALLAVMKAFRRQALHAKRLEFSHPSDNAPLRFEAPLPKDMQDLLRILESDASDRGGQALDRADPIG